MKAPTSNRLLIFVAVTIVGLTLASVLALYLLVQNKKSLPPVAQALLGGRLVHITSDGMYPTLKPGDTVAFDTRAYIDHPPKRGDIVLLIAPGAPSHVLVKRIIAVPSDRLRIANGVVFINGTPISEPYLAEAWTVNNSWPADGMEQLIPPNEYFVLGDNRNHSSDSRAFGTVSRSDILGKLIR